MAKAQTDNLILGNELTPITEKNFFKTEGYYNWCPSIIKGKDGLYHLFYSRWKKAYSFQGWLPLSEIAHAVSNTPVGPWTFKETVLTGRGKGHWGAIGAHNPKIEYFNKKYYLYYISNNYGERDYTQDDLIELAKTGFKHKDWMTLRNNQRTGVAVANSLNGPWMRLDRPIIEPSGPITRLTVNPAIAKGPDNKFYLVVKGDKPGETRFIRNQAVAIGKTPIGPFVLQPKPVIDYIDTEDMSIWYDQGRKRFYGIFHAPQGFLGLITSADGINWDKANGYVINHKEIVMADGSTLKPERVERPYVFVEKGKPVVLAVSVKQGNESWNIFIPIKK
ncbi:glycoside hydrolase family protein [Pedobacter sp. GSP4]|uniref:glycoside hydrolase family protein n=1 Tax=Pedobacter sp. GSP4 TaxID=3453716 RepID=UPI003EEB2085